jgi:hypothetical protein
VRWWAPHNRGVSSVKADNLDADERFVVGWLADKAREFGMRFIRALLVSGFAVWLAAAQPHIAYPRWEIGLVVLAFASLNRFYWIAGMVVGWLVVLYLLPVDVAAGLANLAKVTP